MPAQRRMTFDVDLVLAREIVAAADPGLEAVAVFRLHGGSQEVWRIDLAGGDPVVLKLYADQPAWRPAKEALVASWIPAALGAPVPRWLTLDESRRRLPLAYALMTWLPGRIVRELRGEPALPSIYRQMGALLRRLHRTPMAAYGYILAEGIHDPQTRHAAYAQAGFARAFRTFRKLGADPALAGRLEAFAERRAGLLDHSAGPVLCHDDFQPGNVLAELGDDGSGRLTGLIDFGNALAGDAVGDLAKALFCSAHEDPASAVEILAGYGPIDHPDPVAALELHTLYHRLTMWNWLRGLGDDPAGPSLSGLMRDLEGTTAS